MQKSATLIIGANSEIAKALACDYFDTGERIIVVSRNTSHYEQAKFSGVHRIDMADYQESSIEVASHEIAKLKDDVTIERVFICHGLLHNEDVFPEKRLEDFSSKAFNDVIGANATTPMLWLKYLLPLVNSRHRCVMTFFSARVGSISDNELGGWYSYRASKAALNMLLKSAAIELGRRAKNVKLISFHPGTTDSPLSKPFSHNVAPEKLFSAEFVAKQLVDIVERSNLDGLLSYLDWQGKTIEW